MKAFIFFLLFFSSALNARVEILPKRVIFEPGDRSAEIILQNRSDKDYTFRIRWDDFVYQADERLLYISEGAERITPAASDFVRYAPRQVLLRAGEAQHIRLLLRLPANTPPGEYRSHILLQRQGQANLMQFEDQASGVAMNLQVALGVSLPVIIRHGRGDIQVRLHSAEFLPPDALYPRGAVLLDLEREGLYSTYLDLDIWGGRAQQQLLGRSVERVLHTDANRYRLTFPLQEPPQGRELLLQLSYPRRDGQVQRLRHTLPLPAQFHQ